MASTFDTLYADMMDTFLQVAVGIGMATPTAEADRPEPEERQQSTSESSNADSPSSSRNARSIPRLLVPIRGDGNCQFRAVAYQLWSDAERHDEVRRAAVRQLTAYGERYSPHVSVSYHAYLSSMATPGSWGDHVSLQATADAYAVRIYVVQRQAPDEPTPIEPNVLPTRVRGELWLDFEPEVHYNALTHHNDEHHHAGSHLHDSPPGSSGGSSSRAAVASRRRLSGESKHESSGGWGLDFLWSGGDGTHAAAQDPSPPSPAAPSRHRHHRHHRSSPHPTSVAASHSHRSAREKDVVMEACFDRPSSSSAASTASTASIPFRTPVPPRGFDHTDDAYLHPVTTGPYQRSSSDEESGDPNASRSKATTWRARLDRKKRDLAAKVYNRVKQAAVRRAPEAEDQWRPSSSPPDRPEL